MRKNLLAVVSLAFASSLFAACGASVEVDGPGGSGGKIGGGSESLSYEYEYNKCKTERHTFDSRDAYCKGLQNRALNHGCAIILREQDFKQNCPGTFQET